MKFGIFVFILLLSSGSFSKLRVITTTPDLAWLVRSIGGEKVEVESLLTGSEDPHFADAMPHWISKVAKADVFCQVGMDLEVGWAPKVLSRSGNANVQSGGAGFCDVGKSVSALEVPSGKIDRSMGDVHPGGNPHYHLGPSRFIQAAETVFDILLANDTKSADYFSTQLANTKLHINDVKQRAMLILEGLKGQKILSYHKEFSYFFEEFNLESTGQVEETPGVPPSAGRIARVALKAKANKTKLVLASTINSKKILDKFYEISKVPYVQVPAYMNKHKGANTYEKLILGLAKKIVGE